METAPSDRLLSIIGNDVARACLRALLMQPRTQTELTADLHIAQAATSHALTQLRMVGWVEADGLRNATLRVTAPDSTRQLLLIADHLSEELLKADLSAQKTRTREDRQTLLGDIEGGAQRAQDLPTG